MIFTRIEIISITFLLKSVKIYDFVSLYVLNVPAKLALRLGSKEDYLKGTYFGWG